MRAYLRDGHGRVYWLLLPPAGKPAFQRVFVAVNAALRQAAKAVGDGVELLDDGAIVAPGGHFTRPCTGTSCARTTRCTCRPTAPRWWPTRSSTRCAATA